MTHRKLVHQVISHKETKEIASYVRISHNRIKKMKCSTLDAEIEYWIRETAKAIDRYAGYAEQLRTFNVTCEYLKTIQHYTHKNKVLRKMHEKLAILVDEYG